MRDSRLLDHTPKPEVLLLIAALQQQIQLLLETEAPVMVPKSVDFSFLLFRHLDRFYSHTLSAKPIARNLISSQILSAMQQQTNAVS